MDRYKNDEPVGQGDVNQFVLFILLLIPSIHKQEQEKYCISPIISV